VKYTGRGSSREKERWPTYGTTVDSAMILLNGFRMIKTVLT
jgi:hypothetical protein